MSNVVDFPHPLRRIGLTRAVSMLDVREIPLPVFPCLPVVAPGWTVRVLDPDGTRALDYGCVRGDPEEPTCMLPSPAETALVVAALKEALAALGRPVVEFAGEGRAD